MTSIQQLCAESDEFQKLYECFLPYKDYTESDVAHLPEHLQLVILGVQEVFETHFSLRLFFWLYVKSPFSLLLRPVITQLYNDVKRRL